MLADINFLWCRINRGGQLPERAGKAIDDPLIQEIRPDTQKRGENQYSDNNDAPEKAARAETTHSGRFRSTLVGCFFTGGTFAGCGFLGWSS
jgi:hypothetical protein